MSDVLNKAASGNNIKYGTVTVKTQGSANGFAKDNARVQTNPDGSSTAFWENKLTERFDDPRYYYGNNS